MALAVEHVVKPQLEHFQWPSSKNKESQLQYFKNVLRVIVFFCV